MVKQHQIHNVLERADQRVNSPVPEGGYCAHQCFRIKCPYYSCGKDIRFSLFEADNLWSSVAPTVTTGAYTGVNSAENIPTPKMTLCETPVQAYPYNSSGRHKYCWTHGHCDTDKAKRHDEATVRSINPKRAKEERVFWRCAVPSLKKVAQVEDDIPKTSIFKFHTII